MNMGYYTFNRNGSHLTGDRGKRLKLKMKTFSKSAQKNKKIKIKVVGDKRLVFLVT